MEGPGLSSSNYLLVKVQEYNSLLLKGGEVDGTGGDAGDGGWGYLPHVILEFLKFIQSSIWPMCPILIFLYATLILSK